MLIYVLFNNANRNDRVYSTIKEQLMNIEELPSKVDFILKYCEYLTINESNVAGKKQFFTYCFINMKCPSAMWIQILNEYSLRERNTLSEIDENEIQIAYDNLMLYENIITNKAIEYGKINHIEPNQIIAKIENIKLFYFQLNQNNY